jgi:hypothetical protein
VVNFSEDMISISNERVHFLVSHIADIQRLRFPVPGGNLVDLFKESFLSQ